MRLASLLGHHSRGPDAGSCPSSPEAQRPHRNRRLTIDRDPRFRCFGCCHVKTGALVLGSYYLVVQLLCVAFISVAIVDPNVIEAPEAGQDGGLVVVFDQQKAKATAGDGVALTQALPDALPGRQENMAAAAATTTQRDREEPRLPIQPLRSWEHEFSHHSIRREAHKRVRQGDAHLALALMLGLMAITVLMMYGVLCARPVYLLPFFSYQVFDFILSCLTTLGHYSWLPHVQHVIRESPSLPYQQHLTQLNQQWLSLSILLACVFALIFKAYLIGIVWACYQYLNVRAHFAAILASRRADHALELLTAAGECGALSDDFDEEDAAWRSLLAHQTGLRPPATMGSLDPMFYFAGAGIAPPPAGHQLVMSPPDYDTASKLPPVYCAASPDVVAQPTAVVVAEGTPEPPPTYSESIEHN